MISSPLQLKYRDSSHSPAKAVLLPGNRPSDWFRTLSAAGCDLSKATFLPLTDHTANTIGTICPLDQSVLDQLSPAYPRYSCSGNRLYLPVDASIDPPVSEQTLLEVLPAGNSVFVWHPRAGLIRFESHEIWRVPQLLVPPSETRTEWTLAVPGNKQADRLIALRGQLPADPEDILRQGQDDIGSESDPIKDILRRLSGSQNQGRLSKNLLALAISPIAGGAALFAKLAGSIPGGGGLQQSLLNFMQRASQNILDARERAIQQLLEKLRNDPDEGLKFAIPMADALARGLAAPGSMLTENIVDFRLASGGGGPADSWTIPPSLQAPLTQSYRDLAQREMRLGRFRRAAYIYASLLGDHLAAANALEQGHFYREAAIIYREKLHRPADAANCLERAGLLDEAIDIYRELQNHIKAGELLERLDRIPEAREEFERAVSSRMVAFDRLGAAIIIEDRLHDPDRAMTTLEGAWPGGSQAETCLERFFDITSRLGRQDRAISRLQQLFNHPSNRDQQISLTRTFANVVRNHADPLVKNQASDTTRRIAARVLKEQSSAAVLSALARLVPDDRLLTRDCNRYPLLRETATQRKPQTPAKSGQPKARLAYEIPLPPNIEWRDAISTKSGYYLAGIVDHEDLVVIRGSWSRGQDSQSMVTWKGYAGFGEPVLLPFIKNSSRIDIYLLNGPALPAMDFPRTDLFPEIQTIGTPKWQSNNALAVCNNLFGHVVFTADKRISQFPSGASMDFAVPLTELHAPARMWAGDCGIYVGLNQRIYSIDSAQHRSLFLLRGNIRDIIGFSDPKVEIALVLHDGGAAIIHPTRNAANQQPRSSFGLLESEGFHLRTLDEQTSAPLGAFLGNRHIVLLDTARDFHVYSFSQDHATFRGIAEGKVPHGAATAIQLLPTDHQDRLAVIPQFNGPIEIWDRS